MWKKDRRPLPGRLKDIRRLPALLQPQPEPGLLDPDEAKVTSATTRALLDELRAVTRQMEHTCHLLDAPNVARALLGPRAAAMSDRQVRTLCRTLIARQIAHVARCCQAWCDGKPLPTPPGTDGDGGKGAA